MNSTKVIDIFTHPKFDDILKKLRENISEREKRMEAGSGPPTYFDRFLDARFESIDKTFKSIDRRFDRIEKDISEIRSDIRGLRWWFVGTAIAMLGIVATLLVGYASLQNIWIQRYLEIVQSIPK